MNTDLGKAFDEIIQSQIFRFDRPTDRKYRSRAYSPRDIVDSGDFLRSRMLLNYRDQVDHLWTSDYAMTILVGRRRNDGTYMPGRDWLLATLIRFDVAKAMERYL